MFLVKYNGKNYILRMRVGNETWQETLQQESGEDEVWQETV